MFEKLRLTEQKYEEISEKLSDINVINDNNLYKNLMKEYKNLTPVVEKYREYLQAQNHFDEAKEILDTPNIDKEFREMAQMEYEELKVKTAILAEELTLKKRHDYGK